MDVASVCPFQATSFGWKTAEGGHALTLVVKGTFELTAGKAQLAPVQELPNEADQHWEDDPKRALMAASDMAPFKPRADVVLVGDAYAPNDRPARSVVARLIIGPVEKAIEVHADRHFDTQGQLVEGESFVRMPLRYERAAGGPHTNNPVGIDPEGPRDRYGRLAVPNLLPPGTDVNSPDQRFSPIGFGPLAATWMARQKLLGAHAAHWSEEAWRRQPLPKTIDRSFFNCAPLDQRIDQLNGTERFVLENLHPDEPRLVCHLPGYRPRAFLQRDEDKRPEDVALRADTLWIDTARGICTVTWRGTIDLEQPEEEGRLIVGLEHGDDPLSWERLQSESSTLHQVEDDTTSDAVAPEGASLPFAEGAPRYPRGSAIGDENTAAAMPIPGGDLPGFLKKREARSYQTTAMPVAHLDRGPGWLEKSKSQLPPPPIHQHRSQSQGSSPGQAPAAQAAGPSQAPAHDDASGSFDGGSPWASRDGSPSQHHSAPPPRPVSHPPPAVSAGPMGGAPPIAPNPINPPGSMGMGSLGMGSMGLGGAAVRPPNPIERDVPAAVVQEERSPDTRPRRRMAYPTESIELLWYDEATLPDLRASTQFGPLLDEMSADNDDDPFDFDVAPPEPEPAEVRDRRDIVTSLTRGHVTTAASLSATMRESVDEAGYFSPPLVVMSGNLELPFDPLERLKATLAAVSPLATGNKELQETIDHVKELLATPWLEEGSGGEVAERLTEKVREAFKRGDRLLDPGFLETHTERMLLEQRRYQKRKVFGDEHLRALLKPEGARSAVVVYLPAALTEELPMFRRFPVRVLARAHVQQDQYESSGCALQTLALGRVVDIDRVAGPS